MSTTSKPGGLLKAAPATPRKTSAATAVKPRATDKPQPKGSAPLLAHDRGEPLGANIATPTLVDAAQPVILGPVMRKKELIEAVVARASIKKKDAKPVIDAMLAVLGEALADDRELALPPLGRIMVRKQRDMPNSRVMTVKIRQSKGTGPAANADQDDDSES